MSKPRVLCLMASLLVACASTPKTRPTSPQSGKSSGARRVDSLPIPPEMLEQVARSAAIGRHIYLLDKASAIATDVLMARVPDFRERKLGGYLPFREGDEDANLEPSFMVVFFTRDEPARIAYEIRVKIDAKPDFQAFSPPKPAMPGFARLARARQAAVAALPSHPQPLNPLVMPAEILGEKGIMVYLIAGTTRPNLAVFGRHYRVLVPEDGGPPSYVMPLSKTILEVPVNAHAGSTSVALGVSHVLTDWPLETHVFVSLLQHMPVYVATRVGNWRVDGDRISFLGERGTGADD
jgi:hypothetical protein